MSGGVNSLVSTLTGGLLGGSKTVKVNTTSAQDTAQKETDKAQKATNAALSRKKNRSLLGTGANSTDSGSAASAQAAKQLLGE